jgi:hypothetical protein
MGAIPRSHNKNSAALRSSGSAPPGKIALRADRQRLFSTGKSFTVDGLREKRRRLNLIPSAGRVQSQYFLTDPSAIDCCLN